MAEHKVTYTEMVLSQNANFVSSCDLESDPAKKCREAKEWVKDLFEDTDVDIPNLEENSDCVTLLSYIISINNEFEGKIKEIIEVESCLANFYVTKEEEITKDFAEILPLKDLCSDTYENVKKIALLATHMKLKEPTITQFLIGASDLENRNSNRIEQEMINAYELSKFSKRISDCIQKTIVLERDIEELQKKHQFYNSKQESSNLVYKLVFSRKKSHEYRKRIKTSQERLENLGWNPSLSHKNLVDRSEGIKCLEKKVNTLTEKLEMYQELPPNKMLTRFKIEEAKAELAKLQMEFCKLME